MDITHVTGQDRGDILLYALSTCVWCKRTKSLLNELGMAYRYIDVDLLPPADKDEAVAQLTRHNPSCSFPTLVINGGVVIVGFRPDDLREALGL